MILTVVLMVSLALGSIAILRVIERSPARTSRVVSVRRQQPVFYPGSPPDPPDTGMCTLCGGKHNSHPDDCPVMLSQLYEKVTKRPRKGITPPPDPEFPPGTEHPPFDGTVNPDDGN